MASRVVRDCAFASSSSTATYSEYLYILRMNKVHRLTLYLWATPQYLVLGFVGSTLTTRVSLAELNTLLVTRGNRGVLVLWAQGSSFITNVAEQDKCSK